MSSARDLLDDPASIGARVQLAGDCITVRAGASAIAAALLGRIRQAKPELLALLAGHDRPRACRAGLGRAIRSAIAHRAARYGRGQL
jgi:hypothetical protein